MHEPSEEEMLKWIEKNKLKEENKRLMQLEKQQRKTNIKISNNPTKEEVDKCIEDINERYELHQRLKEVKKQVRKQNIRMFFNRILSTKGLILTLVICIIGYLLLQRFVYLGECVIIKPDKSMVHRIDCPLVKKAPWEKLEIVDKTKYYFKQCKTCHPINIINRILGEE